MQFTLSDPEQTLNLGRRLATGCRPPCVIYLYGELGAGKTTLIRGFLRGMGYDGHVKSPTYTLVEPYEFDDVVVNHFDLYRLEHAHELETIGIDDYFDAQSICLIEWPEQGAPLLPSADVTCYIDYLDDGRLARLDAKTDIGQHILNHVVF